MDKKQFEAETNKTYDEWNEDSIHQDVLDFQTCKRVLKTAVEVIEEGCKNKLLPFSFDIDDFEGITDEGIQFRYESYSETTAHDLFIPAYAIFDREQYFSDLREEQERKRQERLEKERIEKQQKLDDQNKRKQAQEQRERSLLATLKAKYEVSQ